VWKKEDSERRIENRSKGGKRGRGEGIGGIEWRRGGEGI